jgi:hypothetical protein
MPKVKARLLFFFPKVVMGTPSSTIGVGEGKSKEAAESGPLDI